MVFGFYSLSYSLGGESVKEIHISLTGGLGNQIFQLASGLSFPDSKIILETNIGRPRKNKAGMAEISSFNLPDNVSFSSATKESHLLSKALGYGLRMGIAPRWYEKTRAYGRVVTILAQGVYFFTNKSWIKIIFANDIGFFPIPNFRKVLLVGYFQSYLWPSSETAINPLRALNIKGATSELELLSIRAESENPLIVHVRLGDYLLEDSFGVPSVDYYRTAINKLWSTNSYKKIWVFSDDIEQAKDRIPDALIAHCSWIHEVDGSAASTLQAMRYGKGYVLANSSFSWWGCFLSMDANPRVIAPEPWFKSPPSPSQITPPNWELMQADY
jgi:hypothetical protein